jgi:hypothetical protein
MHPKDVRSLVVLQSLQLVILALILFIAFTSGGYMCRMISELPKELNLNSNIGNLITKIDAINNSLTIDDRVVVHERVEWAKLATTLDRRGRQGLRLIDFQLTLSDPTTTRRVYDLMWETDALNSDVIAIRAEQEKLREQVEESLQGLPNQ